MVQTCTIMYFKSIQILVLLCACFIQVASSQYLPEVQLELDSVNKIIATSKSDTALAHAYNELGEILYDSNLDTMLFLSKKAREIAENNLSNNHINKEEETSFRIALTDAIINIGYVHYTKGEINKGLDYFEQALEIGRKINYKDGVATCLNNLGHMHKEKGDIPNALRHYNQCLTFLKEIGNKQNIGHLLSNIAMIYEQIGDINAAIDHHHESLKIKEEIEDQKGIAISYRHLGILHEGQGDLATAFDYYTEALKIQERLQDKMGISHTLDNIATIHKERGDTALAREYFLRSLKIREERGYLKGIASSINNLGLLYKDQGNHTKALTYYNRCLSIQDSIMDIYGSISTTIHISHIYLENGMLVKAKELANKALRTSQQHKYPKLIRNAAHLLFLIYEEEGNDTQKLKTYKLYAKMGDSIKNQSIAINMTHQKLQNEFAKKRVIREKEYEKEIKIARLAVKRQQTYLILTGILILILSTIGVVIFKNEKQKQRLIKSQVEINLLKKERIQTELELRQRELTSSTILMAQKNQFLFKLNDSISKIDDPNKKEDITMELQKLKKEVKIGKHGEKEQVEFQKQFEGVHKDFIKNLKMKYPTLTPNELRICSLIKMNMVTRDISDLLGVSMESLKTFRYRIHKKMKLEKGIKLSDFLITQH